MTHPAHNIAKFFTALTFAASLALGGCAAESSSSDTFPQENATGASAESLDAEVDFVVHEYPVMQVSDSGAQVMYRAIELPEELSTVSRSVLQDIQAELDIDVPVNELREAAAGNEMLIVGLDGRWAETPDLKDCVIETATDEVPGYCFGDEAPTVVEIDRDQLTRAGFVLDAHTDMAMEVNKDIEVPDLVEAF